jgi:hypothetical protein
MGSSTSRVISIDQATELEIAVHDDPIPSFSGTTTCASSARAQNIQQLLPESSWNGTRPLNSSEFCERYIPQLIIQRVCAGSPLSAPEMTHFDAAVAFIDISGTFQKIIVDKLARLVISFLQLHLI